MISKLMKYEMRSSIKMMAGIWGAVIAASLLLTFTNKMMTTSIVQGFDGVNKILSIFTTAATFMYGIILVAMVVITAVIVIMRFYKGLLCDEGYLMHTLPVKPWQLITSKGIVACGMVAISIISGILSFMILSGISGFQWIPDFFGELGKLIRHEPKVILIGIEIILILVLALMKEIYQVYASLAIGQLVGKYRLLLSVGTYIGISTALTILATVFMTIATYTGIGEWFMRLSESMTPYNWFGSVQIMIGIVLLVAAVQVAAFHIITERILTLKLNLQ